MEMNGFFASLWATAIIAKYGNAYAGSKAVWWSGWKNRNYAGSCALMEMMQCD